MNELLEKYRKERFAKNETVSFSPEQIQAMIKQGSDQKLGKIKRNIKIELLFTLSISVVLLSIIGAIFLEYKEVIQTACISIFTTSFYYLMYKRVNRISFTQSDVKTSLQHAIAYLENAIKLYYRIAVFSFPIFYFGFFIFIKLLNNKPFFNIESEDLRVLGIGILVTAVLPLFTKWALKTLYQKHIDELKKNLTILKI